MDLAVTECVCQDAAVLELPVAEQLMQPVVGEFHGLFSGSGLRCTLVGQESVQSRFGQVAVLAMVLKAVSCRI